jgi:hypothetical protein
LVLTVAAFAQEQNAEGTRQMYYLGPQTKVAKAAPSSKVAAAVHLGLRYNIVLVHDNATTEEISSNKVLKEGDCFAIDLQSNRSGYLYVLARQSSGSWTPLFPSPEMTDQRNEIEAFKKVRVPDGYCFTVHRPAGKETLFVVFSRDKKDFFELYESVKAKQEKGAGGNSSGMQLAEAKRVDEAVEHLNERFGDSRDISITRMTEAVKKPDEPRGAVYVVNTSDTPSSSLVTKIEVRHD